MSQASSRSTRASLKYRRNRDAIRRAQIVQAIPAYSVNSDPLLNAIEAAAYLSVSYRTLEKWRSTHPDRLSFVKIGGRSVRYRRSVLDTYISGQAVTDGRGVAK
ncbi:helix-turn-helix transcriptional regulator [Thiothrix fructosivorans]|uniref:Helix-turn-helix domain-containing protein n=1 Tax=Thiothrix fructosivorans TaxID=111770 RepID=A0A8B0SDS5_9GAMM|nr:helix-turn-helix domain-containing protein [Thiothrix fructosivorans]MBO0615390.1 helix-turn-helix domain-containing protein [Thiothrix fructosivorans]QTX10163.1 helix-turn-helix domain-containing protein [Thiothrix fructosivorans]